MRVSKLQLIAAIIFASAILVAVFSAYKYYNIAKDNKRLAANYNIALTEKRQAENIKISEFKEVYARLDELANKLDIRAKNIKEVLEVKYNVKDTTITKTILKTDSVTNIHTFDISNKFYDISGKVTPDSLYIYNASFNDNLKVFIFTEREHWFWKVNKFWKRKNLAAKVWSDYKQDTVLVEKQLHIIE